MTVTNMPIQVTFLSIEDTEGKVVEAGTFYDQHHTFCDSLVERITLYRAAEDLGNPKCQD